MKTPVKLRDFPNVRSGFSPLSLGPIRPRNPMNLDLNVAASQPLRLVTPAVSAAASLTAATARRPSRCFSAPIATHHKKPLTCSPFSTK
jgi:hypothetical protein